MPRSLSISRAIEKPFLSRTGHCHFLLKRKLAAVGTRATPRTRLRPRTRANKSPEVRDNTNGHCNLHGV